MTGIQAPEGSIIPNTLHKNALQITQVFGPLLSAYPEVTHYDKKRQEYELFPVMETSGPGNGGRKYKHGIQIPLIDKMFKFLEIGIAHEIHEKYNGAGYDESVDSSMILRLVSRESEEDFSKMPRICSWDYYKYDDDNPKIFTPLVDDNIWGAFSLDWIDKPRTKLLVNKLLQSPDTFKQGGQLQKALDLLGISSS